MSFPIGTEEEPLWVNVAIVDAKIPMLLGNNILKPFEAEIKLFSTGHGVLVLEDEEFELEETETGHYVVDVSDLGKLCRMRRCKSCKICGYKCESKKSLNLHIEKEHGVTNQTSNCFECKVCGKMYRSRTG